MRGCLGPVHFSLSAVLGYLDVRVVDTDYSSFAVVYIYKELEGALSTMVQLYSEARPGPRPPRAPPRPGPHPFRTPQVSLCSTESHTPKSGPSRVRGAWSPGGGIPRRFGWVGVPWRGL